MIHSKDIDKIAGALAKAQGEFLEFKKEREVEVTMKSGGKYKYCYAELSTVISATRPSLSKYGLSIVQGVEENEKGPICITMLMHESGQWYKNITPMIIKGDGMQDMGGALTFARRYGYQAITGTIAIGEDDDANGSDGKNVGGKPKTKPPEGRGPVVVETPIGDNPDGMELISFMFAVAKKKGWTKDQLGEHVRVPKFGLMSVAQVNKTIDYLKTLPDATEPEPPKMDTEQKIDEQPQKPRTPRVGEPYTNSTKQGQPGNPHPKPPTKGQVSEKQIGRFWALSKGLKWSPEHTYRFIQENTGNQKTECAELTREEYTLITSKMEVQLDAEKAKGK